ncbi:hypothetical protein KGF54_000171 [Candida jiufengensis]|uniref:uncharacterized protein n=1 Tax=Candida jiufengensis TaxID=497108 RepID=UPI00222451A1|nr:uncharacterized protein KGF54_000171 [Candida jiufengensis]KAI5957243.1 hypothetical protein KGF54_000171 [Candida jiufengensis]
MSYTRSSIPIWQNDNEVSQCFICSTKYNFLNRRHHCRKCGKVVCGDCSSNNIHYLDNTPIIINPDSQFYNLQRVQYSKSNETYRTCDECVKEINIIRRVLYDDPNPGLHHHHQENDQIKHNHTREQTRQLPCSSSTTSLSRRQHNTTTTSQDNSSDINLCPVCSNNLLKLYIENQQNINQITNEEFEKFKELHINDCLVSFNFNTDNSTRFSPDSNPKNKMLVYNIPPIPKPTYETIDSVDESPQPTTQEKFDECVICLEDLKPGDKVGRLECLCMFHYKCIKDWFNKKGYGECPVHFLHK